jgi:hypothetical protein
MQNILDLIVTQAADPANEPDLRAAVAAHTAAVRASAARGDRSQVVQAEAVAQRDPAVAFAYDAGGTATLRLEGVSWSAGRFATPSIGELRERMRGARGGRLRLWVLDGASPATDIGALQATAARDTLFQVASQFNCLESPGPYIVPVAHYFSDPTQGPRASISAFPATLLRHYAAPGPDGVPFVQTNGGRQIDLLAGACGPAIVDSGYLTGANVADAWALAQSLEQGFDAIRLGVHDEVEVALGYNWDGGLGDAAEHRIAQVFTSTIAGGSYGGERMLGHTAFQAVSRLLLRAAYLGSLLAAAALARPRVVLTLIGGGVFQNAIEDIWAALCWAIDEARPLLTHDMDVVVNGRNLGTLIDLDAQVLPDIRARDGALLAFDNAGLVTIRR